MIFLISQFEESLAADDPVRRVFSFVVAIGHKSTNAASRRTSPSASEHCRREPAETNSRHGCHAARKIVDTNDGTIPFLIHSPPYSLRCCRSVFRPSGPVTHSSAAE